METGLSHEKLYEGAVLKLDFEHPPRATSKRADTLKGRGERETVSGTESIPKGLRQASLRLIWRAVDGICNIGKVVLLARKHKSGKCQF